MEKHKKALELGNSFREILQTLKELRQKLENFETHILTNELISQLNDIKKNPDVSKPLNSIFDNLRDPHNYD
ncbi:MAG: hypothetical protein H8E32_01350 [Nitrospinae bacterium]|nr:hypothetical protein [Nitrospinota bacterium]